MTGDVIDRVVVNVLSDVAFCGVGRGMDTTEVVSCLGPSNSSLEPLLTGHCNVNVDPAVAERCGRFLCGGLDSEVSLSDFAFLSRLSNVGLRVIHNGPPPPFSGAASAAVGGKCADDSSVGESHCDSDESDLLLL